MATKKFLELKEMSDAELTNELAETVVQFQKQKFDHAIKGLDNPILLRGMRKDVARLKTEIRRREVEAFTPEQIANRENIRRRRRK